MGDMEQRSEAAVIDEVVDLRDHRGRLLRFALACAIGIATAFGGLSAIEASYPEPAPLNLVSVLIIVLVFFVVTTAFSLKLLTVIARRLRR